MVFCFSDSKHDRKHKGMEANLGEGNQTNAMTPEDTGQKELLIVKFTVMISFISTYVHCMLCVELLFSISRFLNVIQLCYDFYPYCKVVTDSFLSIQWHYLPGLETLSVRIQRHVELLREVLVIICPRRFHLSHSPVPLHLKILPMAQLDTERLWLQLMVGEATFFFFQKSFVSLRSECY